MVPGCRTSVGVYSFNFRRFERLCKGELFPGHWLSKQYQIGQFVGLLLAYLGLFFGPKLETSQLVLHTIAKKSIRIGTAFTFFLATTVKTVANWPILGQFWPSFGPELETSQLLLHTIAMKAMRIGTAFKFFLAMAVEAVALAKGTAESCCTMVKTTKFRP